MSLDRGVIEISEKPAPQWGKTSHDATLLCPHGKTVTTVFGDDAQRKRMALEMAPGHRARNRCSCEPGELIPA